MMVTQASVTVHVQLHDFTTLAEMVGDLLSVPDSALSGPDWTLEPSNPAFSEARLSAIREAQRIAIDYAAAFGATLSALEEVIDDAWPPDDGAHDDASKLTWRRRLRAPTRP
ncbi:MAG: SIMPL domain-containing protein [Marmoricola sp.]